MHYITLHCCGVPVLSERVEDEASIGPIALSPYGGLRSLAETGVLIYEMLVGYPPFFDENAIGIYEKILAGRIDWPRFIDPVAKDLIKKLLVQDRTRRLGAMRNGAQDVMAHRWFRNIDWSSDVTQKKLKVGMERNQK
ncbi:unnamed protein product [Cyprideis torosa]|uniref:Uncharacterized protein n=1 Tax=Cyprideis torosa TaxID=163714 RepID=A0A7R8WG25_9CRUS|nr:unnamed protein product [Cyprideis torosa]CAG0897574.1 unnamed protein product [Cyprideis torosa]